MLASLQGEVGGVLSRPIILLARAIAQSCLSGGGQMSRLWWELGSLSGRALAWSVAGLMIAQHT